MIIKLENTSTIMVVNGEPARVWEGETEKGIKVFAFISRLAVKSGQEDAEEKLRKELEISRESCYTASQYPLKMIV